MSLTALTFLWRGWRPVYRASHVNAWARQVRAFLPSADRIVCITDMPRGITECETFPLWTLRGLRTMGARRPNCFARLPLFDPQVGARFGERIVQIDLDSTVRAPLKPLITDHDFRAVRGECAPLNGSMWMLRTGTHAHVWRDFDPKTSPMAIWRHEHNGRRIIGSDQAWMSMKIPDAATWGPEDGVLQFMRITSDDDAAESRIVFFAGGDKPWSDECRRRTPALHADYMRWLH
jgi:hypothetical protein